MLAVDLLLLVLETRGDKLLRARIYREQATASAAGGFTETLTGKVSRRKNEEKP